MIKTQTAGLDPASLVELLKPLAPREGYNLTILEGVRILRSDRALPRTPVLYDPGIVIVCQGCKRGYWGDQVYLYDEQHYLAVALPVPFTMETEATAEHPLLAIYLHLDFQLAADLMLEIDQHPAADPETPPQGMFSTPMDEPVSRAVERLLQALNHPLDASILGPSLLRELYYRVLRGPQGGTLRAALAMRGQFGKIGKALRRIHADYAAPLDLTELAQEAGMSVPTFHAHFKTIVKTSPIQYVKSTRLHQARLLMVRNGMTGETASHAVGYASPSQFNREFKRLFGATPAAEARRLRNSFALPPAQENAVFVSSH